MGSSLQVRRTHGSSLSVWCGRRPCDTRHSSNKHRWQWVSGSRVKWVNKSEWVTGQYSWLVDPWSSSQDSKNMLAFLAFAQQVITLLDSTLRTVLSTHLKRFRFRRYSLCHNVSLIQLFLRSILWQWWCLILRALPLSGPDWKLQ